MYNLLKGVLRVIKTMGIMEVKKVRGKRGHSCAVSLMSEGQTTVREKTHVRLMFREYLHLRMRFETIARVIPQRQLFTSISLGNSYGSNLW